MEIDCSVTAYFCDESNTDVGQPTFAQGDIMTVCVSIASEDAGKYFLDDVIEMGIEQTKGTGAKATSSVITSRFPSPLSSKRCRNGVCNMRHLVQSKFFDERNPGNLDLAGMALCGFGNFPQFSRRRSVTFAASYGGTLISSSSSPQDIEACKTECAGTAGCEAILANAVGNPELDEWNCGYYNTHPAAEEFETSASAEIYMLLNDAWTSP